MKVLKYILVTSVALGLAYACNEGIDSISKVDPGEDEAAPSISLTYPNEDILIPFTDEQADVVDIQFEVTDDIELGSVSLSLDGDQLSTYDTFIDYRRYVGSYEYDGLPVGEHTILISSTDLAGKNSEQSFTFEVSNKYVAKYDGEVFFMPFEGDLYMELITETEAAIVGEPTFAAGKSGDAYAGASGSYLSFPIDDLIDGDGFSATMWYQLDASPDRAGIISISPEGEDRTKGIRFFREGSATEQRFKLNVGNGEVEQWNDGGTAAPSGEWVHLAFTVSETATVIYINGEVTTSTANAGIDWSGLTTMSIGSGLPNFAYWGHESDNSLIDDLRIYDKALTQDEVKTIIGE